MSETFERLFAGGFKGIIAGFLMCAVSTVAFCEGTPTTPATPAGPEAAEKGADQDLKFRITTTMGVIEGKLFYKQAPKTVSNFVELARKGFYNGIIFHRVIKEFMIQTGDPKGNGTGGPGYTFADEIIPELKHSKPGMLSMANSGPNTNGSQFFITVKETPNLDGRHAVFGEVTSGLDVAIKISEVKTAPGDRPEKDLKMDKVEILGDWFKPVAVEKIKEMGEDDLKKLTQKPIETLLKKIGEAQSLGNLQKASFGQARSRGDKAQVEFSADFEKSKGAQLLLYGEVKNNNFEILQFQFAKGDATKTMLKK